MGKRKRNDNGPGNATTGDAPPTKKQVIATESVTNGDGPSPDSISLQIITGSYDRVLHGIIATIPLYDSPKIKVHFQDNFLFNAHASAVKCLALSPAISEDNVDAGKVMLATGGTDEKINLYSISTSLPSGPSLPTLSSVPSLENSKNKELGSLLHHNSSVTALHFPSKSKLISASNDNTIAISRTRDWTVLSTVKAPMPKIQGRPSGDTAPPGGSPAGISDFSVHPSMKLMISVGKGEKCMRLWNLVTGKKANVLNFEKDLLKAVGESKWSRGEGQKIEWNSAGDEFAIAFERGVAIFGMDSEVKCVAVPQSASKIHQITYISSESSESLAVSTEDGRVIFYTTEINTTTANGNSVNTEVPIASEVATLGGKEAGVKGRIKDFIVISSTRESANGTTFIITAGSDGAVMLWQLKAKELSSKSDPKNKESNPTVANGTSEGKVPNGAYAPKQIGRLLGKYDTGNRITCMTAFQLQGNPDTEENVSGDNSLGESEQESGDEDEFSGFE